MLLKLFVCVLLSQRCLSTFLPLDHNHHLEAPGDVDTDLLLGGVHHAQHSAVLDDFWDEFKNIFNKSYSRRFEPLRRLAWEENLLKVHIHNEEAARGIHNYTLRENHLADLTLEDYIKEMIRLTRSRRRKCDDSDLLMAGNPMSIPEELDWRLKGFITPPMNQEDCGACYAFSIGTLIQAQIFKYTGQLIPLSEQQIVDCSVGTGNLGCSGGSLRNTMRYVMENGLMSYEDYPYISQQKSCKYSPGRTLINITDWRTLPPRDEEALKMAVATIGPVAVSVNASPHTFMLYHNGIYHDPECSSDTVNHAMLLVGYTRQYWILKNWWSEHWGMSGYMHLERGTNRCGVANFAAYAVI